MSPSYRCGDAAAKYPNAIDSHSKIVATLLLVYPHSLPLVTPCYCYRWLWSDAPEKQYAYSSVARRERYDSIEEDIV